MDQALLIRADWAFSSSRYFGRCEDYAHSCLFLNLSRRDPKEGGHCRPRQWDALAFCPGASQDSDR
jgi:hypothetical protein